MAWTLTDGDAASDNATLSAAIPQRARANTLANVTDRPTVASRTYLPIGGPVGLTSTTRYPYISGHPDDWIIATAWTIPAESLLGSETVRARVLYRAEQSTLDVRLRVGDNVSSSTTVVVDTVDDLTNEMSCDVPSQIEGDIICAIEVRAHPLDSPVTVTIERFIYGPILRVSLSSGSLPAGRAARLLRITGASLGTIGQMRQTYFVGRINNALGASGEYDLHCWPYVDMAPTIPWSVDAGAKDTASLYPLGVFRPRSVIMYAAGSNGALPIIPLTTVYPGAVVRGRTPRAIYDHMHALWRSRAWIYTLGGTHDAGCTGVRTIESWSIGGGAAWAASQVAAAVIEVSADAPGVTVTAIYHTRPQGGVRGLVSPVWTAYMRADPGATPEDTAITTTAPLVPIHARVDDPGTLSGYGATYAPEQWGGADCMASDDRHHLEIATLRVPWPAGVSAGDMIVILVTVEAAPVIVHGVTIREDRQ